MPEWEKVIRGLTECLKHPNLLHTCEDCPYYDKLTAGEECATQIMRDALALLKEQEPRVMTVDEAEKAFKTSDFFVFEDIKNGIVLGMRCHDVIYVSVGMYMEFDDLDDPVYRAAYGMQFRMWTSRPTDEQRKNTPWEPPKEEEDG